MRQELKDVSFLIALKVDSQDRIDNLDITINYLLHHFDVEIIISEQGPSPILKDRYISCKYIHEKNDEFFNRQKGVNIAAKQSNKRFIAHYDADIILTPAQITKSIETLRSEDVNFILPYNGYFYDVPKQFHNKIKETKSLSEVDINKCTLFTTRGVGGVVLFDRELFWKNGGANENFKGLGYEDNEIFDRFRILKAKMARLDQPLFHLNHVRKETSYNHNPYVNDNANEYRRIVNMSKEELVKEISTWRWINDKS